MFVSLFRNLRKVALAPLFGFQFAKLPTKAIDIKKSEIQEDFEGYYEDVLRVAKTTKTGRMKVEPEYLSSLLKKVENVKDYRMLLDAYFNFVGHSAVFPHKMVDSLIRKGIELRQTNLLIPIIENHNFLFYYPAPDVLTMLISDIVKNESYEKMQKFIKVFHHQRLLRPEPKTFEIMVAESLKTTHYKNGLKILSQLSKREMVVSMLGFEELAQCAIHYYRRLKRKGLSEKRFKQLQNVMDRNQEKTSKAYFLLAWLHILRKEYGSFSFSLLSLEDYCKKLVEEKSKDAEKNKDYIIFENNPLTLNYFAYFEKKVLAQDDPRYMLKFDKFFADFETNFGASRISPEVLPKISEIRQKLTAKAKEIEEKGPELYAQLREKMAARILKRNKKLKEMEFRRKMRAEEKKTAIEEENKRKKRERRRIVPGKEQQLDALDINKVYEVRRKRTIKKTVEDPETRKKTVVVTNNAEGKDPDVTGVIYRRKK